MLGLRFDEHTVAEGIKRLGFAGRDPAVLILAGFSADDFIDDGLPGARGGGGITVAQIHAGQTQVHGRLLAGFIQGDQHARGLGLVFGLEALECLVVLSKA